MMNWAVGREYIERTPFRRGTETLVRKIREDNQRRRRIAEDEEARLLTVAPPLLRSMIIAALDTGCEHLALAVTHRSRRPSATTIKSLTTSSPQRRGLSAARRSIPVRENRSRRQSVKFLSRVWSMRMLTSTPIACAKRVLRTGKISI
jgi:hypothetical protein